MSNFLTSMLRTARRRGRIRTAVAVELLGQDSKTCRDFLRATRIASFQKEFLTFIEGQKFRNPDTGNQVVYYSLPKPAQKLVYERWKKSRKRDKDREKIHGKNKPTGDVERARSQTTKIYADSNELHPGEDGDLDFRSKDWISVEDWFSVMKDALPEGYNSFMPKQFFDNLKEAEENTGTSFMLQTAREGSPAAFVRGSKEALKKLQELVDADDIERIDADPPEMRFWWD